MGIPIIIESGGIKQFIKGALKSIFPDIEEYIKQEKIIIVANDLIFDNTSKICIGFNKDVIHALNKSESLAQVVNTKLSGIKKIFVFGDQIGDADCVSKLKLTLDDIIRFGFYNIEPKFIKENLIEENIKSKINEYKNAYDVVLVVDSDYQPFIKLFNKNKGI